MSNLIMVIEKAKDFFETDEQLSVSRNGKVGDCGSFIVTFPSTMDWYEIYYKDGEILGVVDQDLGIICYSYDDLLTAQSVTLPENEEAKSCLLDTYDIKVNYVL